MYSKIWKKLGSLNEAFPIPGRKASQLGPRAWDELNLKSLNGYVPLAFILTEDARFMQHAGLNWRAFLHRQYPTLRGESGCGVGSFISQQVMKVAFFGRDASIIDKIFEAFYAICAENIFKKGGILRMY